ncbi:kinase [Thraustotheca clavata]|uniref:Kinase n=1 Tax=Thraustotheca clavata TaxID=74557 RepID=A0A1W0AA72_9STRA|nr:kinase [Thraustotheca clavata]
MCDLLSLEFSMESSDSEIVDIGVLSDGQGQVRWDKAGIKPVGEVKRKPLDDIYVTGIEIGLEKLTCKSPAYVESWRHEFGAEIDRLQKKLMELRSEVDRRRRDMQFEDWYIQRTLTTGDMKDPMFAAYIQTLQEKYAGNVSAFEAIKAKLRKEEKKVELFSVTAFNELPLLAFRYQLKTIIGHGGNSVVWEAYDTETQQFVAIKISNKIHHAEQEYHNHEMFLGSEHTVRLHGPLIYIKHQCNPYSLMIMDRMECDLNQFMENRKGPCELALARHILFELLLGLHYLHEKNMAHCDLKPANILLTTVASAQARLTDFHLSRPKSSTIIVGQNASPAFAPPEWYLLSTTEAHTQSATYEKFDIWAVGLIFYILLCNQHPLGTQSSKVDMTDRMMEYRNHPQIYFPSYIPRDVQELLKQCMHIDWHCRPTTKQLLAIVCYK